MQIISLVILCSSSLATGDKLLLLHPALQMRIMFEMANRRPVPLDKEELRKIFSDRWAYSEARLQQIFQESSKIPFWESASTRIPKMQELLRQKERLVNHDYIVFLARVYFIELYPQFRPPYPMKFRSIFG